MKNEMKEITDYMPRFRKTALFILPIIFFIYLPGVLPVYAFGINAFVWMFFIHYAVNFPAMIHSEDCLYKEEPLRFFDAKVKYTFQLWAVGVLLMAVLFFVSVDLVRFVPGSVFPEIDITSSLVLLMLSLIPFIPATFALMKASYTYRTRPMAVFTIVLLVLVLAGIVVPSIMTGGFGSIDRFAHFDPLPYLPLSACVLAVSMIVSFFLSKSARKSFIRYAEMAIRRPA